MTPEQVRHRTEQAKEARESASARVDDAKGCIEKGDLHAAKGYLDDAMQDARAAKTIENMLKAHHAEEKVRLFQTRTERLAKAKDDLDRAVRAFVHRHLDCTTSETATIVRAQQAINAIEAE